MQRIPVGVALVILTVIVALVAAACGGGDEAGPTPALVPSPTVAPTATPAATATPTPERPKTGGVLRWAKVQDIADMDLHKTRHPQAAVAIPIMSWLVVLTGDKGLQPDLAERWQSQDDGKAVTFSLARNAKWHDGRPVTADDVVYTLNRIAFSDELKTGAYRASFAVLDKAERVDDFTVRLALKRPSASFLSALGINQILIYPKHIPVAEFAKKTPQTVIGSGPYKFKDFVSGVATTVTRNPDYFKNDETGNPLPYLDGIEFPIIRDAAAHYAAFRVGQVDITDQTYAAALEGKERQVTQDVPGAKVQLQESQFTFLNFNTAKKPGTMSGSARPSAWPWTARPSTRCTRGASGHPIEASAAPAPSLPSRRTSSRPGPATTPPESGKTWTKPNAFFRKRASLPKT